jgi:predicted nucleic acid-binding protein
VLGTLFDTSVWLAATFDQHPAHRVARQALREATATNPAVFCRATEQSYRFTPIGLNLALLSA